MVNGVRLSSTEAPASAEHVYWWFSFDGGGISVRIRSYAGSFAIVWTHIGYSKSGPRYRS